MAATVLVLGGTSEARALAAELAVKPELRVISSLAGRVSNPSLPAGEVRVGGFGGAAGLAAYARAEGIGAVVDATHPFAETISAHAVEACQQAGLPLLRLARPAWTPRDGDDWREAGSPGQAAAMLPGLGTRVFLTTGRQGLAAFAGLDRLWFLIRCVDPPDGPLPANREILLARGPYERQAERALMRRHGIDVLVTKNSGGPLTEGKLDAARDLGIPVIMISRPAAAAAESVTAVSDAVRWVGILSGMTMTTIKVPKATRDRLHRLAAADGVTLAQEIDKLVKERSPRPRPSTGGFRSDRPLSAEEIDEHLAVGFGGENDGTRR
jgi:precorrin-6A/cobalt-precorrin-6A reductase